MKKRCDGCNREVHPDVNGFWLDEDETPDCPKSNYGHHVDRRTWV